MPSWYASWIASLPLVLITVLFHVVGLSVIRDAVIEQLEHTGRYRQFGFFPALVMAGTVLVVTVLHALEAAVWGVAYLVLGALPDASAAMLYSLSAMTTYGHASIYLDPHWQMMGAVEALNGVILFGLTVATLISIIESGPRPAGRRRRRE